MTLAVFDLDHTLLDGDSHVLWCDFLRSAGRLTAAQMARHEALQQGYREQRSSAEDICSFYIGLFAGGTQAGWAPWVARYQAEQVAPRLTPAAHALVQQHRDRGHTLLLSSATNRELTTGSAAALGIPHLIATEVETVAGRYTGRAQGVLNMREGKVQRLLDWLAARGQGPQALADAWFYSDSINDLPLLSAVGHPVAVNPDERLRAQALDRGWPVLQLASTAAA